MIGTSDILRQIKQTVLSVDPTAEVILFGSRARGDFDDESDWDVLVLTDKPQEDWKHRQKIRSAIYYLQLELDVLISTIVRNRQFWEDISVTPLYKEVEKDGIKL